MTGLLITLIILALGLAIGLALRARNGSIRRAAHESTTQEELPVTVARALQRSGHLTLVQLSTAFCAPCRHTHARLAQLVERTSGLSHTAIDITDDPDLAQSLGVLRTPTTIAYDSSGRELLRVTGVPETGKLLEALQPHLAQASER